MKVRQNVSLLVTSDMLTPDEISERLGIASDASVVLGSKRAGPRPSPRRHLWHLHPLTPRTARLDEQLSALLERLSGLEAAIKRLTESGQIDAGVQIVRYFESGPESDEVLSARDATLPPGLQVLRGQHPLLGFHLEAGLLARLANMGVSLDFDEYGDEWE